MVRSAQIAAVEMLILSALERAANDPKQPFARSTEYGGDSILLRNPFRNIVYVQVHRGHVIARIPSTNHVVEVKCNALSHTRTLMGDFDEIVECFKEVLKELGQSKRMWLKPRLLVHLIPKFDGGYTKVELRAFREAAESAGGIRTYMLADHDPISDQELLTVYKHFT